VTMLRIFRAFGWMRWRVFVNSLERTGARDTLERFSVATDKLGPIIAMLLLIPSALLALALGLATGFGTATGAWAPLMGAVRGILLVMIAITGISPLIMPMRDSSTVVRLLLLPIPRQLLYVAQTAAGLGDPWILLCVPLLGGVALGLAIGLQFVAALLALVAALAFLVLLTGLASLTSSVIHLLLRDRRRGEIVMFLLIFMIPLMSILPQLLIRERRGPGGRPLTRAERQALPPSTTARVALRVAPYLPSEMYRRTAINAVGSPAGAVVPLAELAGIALLVQTAGFAAYRRVLDMPVSLGMRRAGSFGGLWDRLIPGLSRSASAVAFTQLRLALRTPRGRATLFTPLFMSVLLGAVGSRHGGMSLPGLQGERGLPIAAIGVFASVLALLPLAMNQFAIDRAGFTRYMLSPLSIGELLAGKAIGNAMIAAIPATFCLIVSAVFFGTAHPLLWPALVFAVVATYSLLAPVAATLSALFPKTVDLNSIGNNSNAHQAAGLLGMLSFALSAAPALLLALFALAYLDRPELVPVLLLVWAFVAYGIGQLLFIPVRRFVTSRCETLAQYY
jgi:hypothetical protein